MRCRGISFVFASVAPVVAAVAHKGRRTTVSFAAGRTFFFLFLAFYQNYVLADFCYGGYGNKLLLTRKPEAFSSGNEKTFHAVFGIKKYQIAHPAEVFAVVEADDVQLFNDIIRKFHSIMLCGGQPIVARRTQSNITF